MDSHRPAPGARFGDFELEAPLGRGGWGAVWAARHLPTRSPVALKLLDCRSDLERAAVRREVDAVGRLRHRHVVAIHDHGEQGPLAWFAMERAAGHLGAAPPRSGRALDRALRSLLDGLAHAHARGLVHRDLKPTNLLWSATGELLVADFGVARVRGTVDALPGAGSAGWRAPEQGGPDGDLGPWTDLYAVGRLAASWADPEDLELLAWAARLASVDPSDRPRCAAEALLELPSASGVRSLRVVAPPTDVTRPAGAPTPTVTATAARWRSLPVPPGFASASALPDHLLRTSSRLLLGRRPAALVGRQAEQEQAWDALRRSVDGPVALRLDGPAGVGRSAFAAWLGHRAAELGATVWWGAPGGVGAWLAAATGFRPSNPTDAARWAFRRGAPASLVERLATPDPELGAEVLAFEPGPRVWIADGVEVAPLWAAVLARRLPALLVVVGDLADAEVLALEPLAPETTRAALAELLPLDPAFSAELVSRCGGRPAVAARWLSALSAAGDLRRGPTGFLPDDPLRFRIPGLPRPDLTDEEVVAAIAGIGDLDPDRRQAAFEQASPDQARRAAALAPPGSRRGTAWWLAGDPTGAAVEFVAAVDAAIARQEDYATVLGHAERLARVLPEVGGPAHPRWHATMRNRMHCRARCGDLDGADAEAEAFLSRDDLRPEDRGSALSLRANVALFRGRPEEALALLDAIPPEAVDRGHTWRTTRCWALGRLRRWSEVAEVALVPDPTVDLWRMRGGALFERGDLAGAEACLARAREGARTIDFGPVEHLQARLHQARGDTDAALAACARAVAAAGGEVERLVPATDATVWAALAGYVDRARSEAEPLLERARAVRFVELETLLCFVLWATSLDPAQGLAWGRDGAELLRRGGVVTVDGVRALIALAVSRAGDHRAEAERLAAELG